MQGVDVCTLLKGDHERLRSLVDEMCATEDPERIHRMMRSVRNELLIHRRLAEEVFYPEVTRSISERPGQLVVQHAKEEHRHAERAFSALEETEAGSPTFRSRLDVLRALIGRHIEEEERQVFDRLRDHLDTETMQKMGRLLNQRRLELERVYRTHAEQVAKEVGGV